MNKPVINVEDLEYKAFGKGDKFHAERGQVSPLIGAKQLGYAVIRLQPGKRAWPYHSHHATEEMFYVISGAGTLRHADEEYPIREGDFICSPADPTQPHQIINTSEDELVYMALSNEMKTDVMLYPDSGKFGVWHGDVRHQDAPDNFLMFGRKEDALDYWDGEDED
ncbi:MAG: cupin domain-containing protein [Woeseiaceae bacterium]|jgi:uncharacterized cupin superfamily protein